MTMLCLHQAFRSLGSAFVSFKRLPVFAPACISMTAAAAGPAVAAGPLSSQGAGCICFWQPLMGSAIFVAALLVILGKMKESARLQRDWAAKAEEVRLAKAAALGGKPLPS